jgi:hypothetical protein
VIEHTHSVERLYPSGGKHDLQNSLSEAFSLQFGFRGYDWAAASLNYVGIFMDS